MKRNKVTSRFADNWSGFFMPSFLFFLAAFIILYPTFFFPPRSIFLNYFLIGMGGTLPSVILSLLARPYPFGPNPYDADMCHIQDVSLLGIKERKVLTFWKKSEEIIRVIWKSEVYLLLLIFLLAIVSFILEHLFDRRIIARLANVSLHDVSWQARLFGLFMASMIYFIFSLLFIEGNLSRFLKRNIDRIAAMDIEPWPANKPYMPVSLSFMNRPQKPQSSLTYIDEILRMDPKTPFTWSGFIRLLMIPVAIFLSWVIISKLASSILKYITAYSGK